MIGERIKEYLDGHGISATFVAKSSKVSYKKILRILAGQNKNVNVLDYWNICKALELNPGYFIENEVNEDAEDDDPRD